MAFGGARGWRRYLTLSSLRAVPTRYKAGVLGLLCIAAVPAALRPLQLSQLVTPLYLMMFAISWDLVSGYTGQISFGHTLFFGLGAYTTTVLNLQHSVPPHLSIPAGMVVAMLGGVLIGVPALRVRGPYLSLITLIAPLIFAQLTVLYASNLPILAPHGLGGNAGFASQNDPIVGSPTPTTDPLITVSSFRMETIVEFYVAFAALLVVLGISLLVTRSDTGAVFTAIREDEDVVAAVGLTPSKYKIFAFVLSAGLAGLSAALFVHSNAGGNPLQPDQVLTIQRAVEVIIMAILGGMGTIVGAAVGAVFFVATTIVLGLIDVTIPIVDQSPAELSPIPVFVLAILVLMFEPGGLVRWAINAGTRLRATVRGETAETADGETPLERTIESYLEELRRFRN